MILLFKIVEFTGEHNTVIVNEFIGIFGNEAQKNDYLDGNTNDTGDYLKYRQFKCPNFRGPIINPGLDIVRPQIIAPGCLVKCMNPWGGYDIVRIVSYDKFKYKCSIQEGKSTFNVDETRIYEIINNDPK